MLRFLSKFFVQIWLKSGRLCLLSFGSDLLATIALMRIIMEIKELSHNLAPIITGDSFLTIPEYLKDPASSCDDVFSYAKELKFGELHFKMDPATGLFAIIAIHSTKLGPAIGGCRCIAYASTHAAILDAVRLAHMMSYKAAICGLPHGGAKAVLIKPDSILQRSNYFHAFGEFVDQLNGRYVTAVDSGTDVPDMDLIAQRTSFVTCSSQMGGDPSPLTAVGVKRGIEAAVKFKFGKDDLKDIHVAIQGAGHVGHSLASLLSAAGARLTMTDINTSTLKRCVAEFGVTPVTPEEIYQIKCDVFAPCALGAVLNAKTIAELNTEIVAGSANNQLKDLIADDQRLFQKGILYAPDFLINAGGLIYAAAAYDHGSLERAEQRIHHIYEASLEIFKRAKAENQPTNHIALVIAAERLE
jgi:leucine dehydrogenase